MKISRTYRLSPATLQMIADLQTLYDQLSDKGSVSATEIIELAVARWHGAENERRGQMDRVEQVNFIYQLAENIAANLGEGTAEELVAYALSDEGRESWGIELFEGFDDADRDFLTSRVAILLD